MDGRIVGFLQWGFFSGTFLIPDIAQKSDALQNLPDYLLTRLKETVNSLKKIPGIKVVTNKNLTEREGLKRILKKERVPVISADNELKKELGETAKVVLIDEIYESLKPVYLPGTTLRVKIIKRGKDADEGIGYLEDGIKVVVSNGASHIGKEIEIVVSGSLDTPVGRVIFAKPKYEEIELN